MHCVSIYTYFVDTQPFYALMTSVKTVAPFPARYCQLQRQLAQIGYLSQGSVFERAPGQQGSRYVWTRKVKAKTVTVALSEQQYRWLRKAVSNQRNLERVMAQMQRLSRQVLFENVPGVLRRKRLGKRALGLI
jgi:virulence-associated protein VapD